MLADSDNTISKDSLIFKDKRLSKLNSSNPRDEGPKYVLNVNSNQEFITRPELLTNRICTSKYTFYNAVPKILWEQLSKIGNLYFLGLAILQLIPSVTQSGGVPIILMPLLFVVIINGVKDFCEDYKRKQSDSRENKTNCILISDKSSSSFDKSNSSSEVFWENLKPGDIVKINKNDYFPADLLLLYSTNKNGVAYVETKNLDGETNLKYKESVKNSYNLLKYIERDEVKDNVIKNTFGVIDCEYPNALMYEFKGIYFHENRKVDASVENLDRKSLARVETENLDMNTQENKRASLTSVSSNDNLPVFNRNSCIRESIDKKEITALDISANKSTAPIVLDYNNFLLRGSSLRNTDYVYGIVIFAGHNSKIMLNSLTARTKQSKVFKIMNSQLKFIILLQVILCLTFGIFYSIDSDPYNFIFPKQTGFSNALKNFFYAFFTWLLTISNIVPISLLVTLEMIKFCQALFISWDYKMYDKENKRTAIVQSSSLNEELGQIIDIFTDKTGTLTKNIMQFKYVVIGEYVYGSDKRNIIYLYLDIDPTILKEKGITNVDFNDDKIYEHWNKKDHPNSKNIQ